MGSWSRSQRAVGPCGFASLGSGLEPGAPEANPYSFFMTQLGATIYKAFLGPLGTVSPASGTEPWERLIMGTQGCPKEAGVRKRLEDCTCH